MSQRPGFIADHFVKADGRWPFSKSPNQFPDVISVQMRCHWPPLAPKSEVRDALHDCYLKAIAELDDMRPDD